MRILRRVLLAVFALGLVAEAWAGCPPSVVTRLAKPWVSPAHRKMIKDYWKNVPPGSKLEEGLMTAMRLGEDDAAKHVSGIIEVLGESEKHFERIARLKRIPGLKDEIVALGSRNKKSIDGASAEMRFADERIGAEDIETFQHQLDNRRPDIMDRFGNLYEVKYRTYPDWMTDEMIKADLQDILDQAWEIQREAAANGKTFTLAFEQPMSPRVQAIFDPMFSTLKARQNVAIVITF